MRVGIATTFADKLLTARGELLSALLDKGHSLIVFGAEPEENCISMFEKFNITYKRTLFNRNNTNPIEEINFIQHTKKMMKALHIDVLLIYGVRLSGSLAIAAKLAGIPRIYAVINGRGTLFFFEGMKGTVIRALSYPLLLIGLHLCEHVFFQNSDDQKVFVKRRLVKDDHTSLVAGSGVNLEKFVIKPMPKECTFLFIGRMIRDKGIYELLEAARIVKSNYPETKFLCIGPFDQNVTALCETDLRPFIKSKVIEHIEWTDNINHYLMNSIALVLPSYHEGIPRVVLEAMASGRAIITTDAPGCRETVVEGLNGFLVPIRDSKALAERIIWMIQHRDEVERMGQESYRICREKYDVHQVNERIIKTMGL